MKYAWLTVLILSTYGQKFRTFFLCAPMCKAGDSLHTLNLSSLRFFLIHPESPTARCFFIMFEPLIGDCLSVRPEPLTYSSLSISLELPTARCFFILSEPLSVHLWSLTARCVSIHCKALTARCFCIHRKSLTTRCLSIGTDSPPSPKDVSLYLRITHRQILKYTLKSLTARCVSIHCKALTARCFFIHSKSPQNL
jgi:hypothetical protein